MNATQFFQFGHQNQPKIKLVSKSNFYQIFKDFNIGFGRVNETAIRTRNGIIKISPETTTDNDFFRLNYTEFDDEGYFLNSISNNALVFSIGYIKDTDVKISVNSTHISNSNFYLNFTTLRDFREIYLFFDKEEFKRLKSLLTPCEIFINIEFNQSETYLLKIKMM